MNTPVRVILTLAGLLSLATNAESLMLVIRTSDQSKIPVEVLKGATVHTASIVDSVPRWVNK